MEKMTVESLVGRMLRFDREVEALSTAQRWFMGQQVATITWLYEDTIKPYVSGSEEAYEMERMLRYMEDFGWLDEPAWRRLRRAKKQAIDVMRATTEIIMRRLVTNVLEHGEKSM